MDAYRNINDKFGIPLNMESKDLTTVHEQGDALCAWYLFDLDQNFTDEIIKFRSFVQSEQDKSP